MSKSKHVRHNTSQTITVQIFCKRVVFILLRNRFFRRRQVHSVRRSPVSSQWIQLTWIPVTGASFGPPRFTCSLFQIVNIHRGLCSCWRCEALCLACHWVTFVDTWQGHVSQGWGMPWWLNPFALCCHTRQPVKLCCYQTDEFKLIFLNGPISMPLLCFIGLHWVSHAVQNCMHAGHWKYWQPIWFSSFEDANIVMWRPHCILVASLALALR